MKFYEHLFCILVNVRLPNPDEIGQYKAESCGFWNLIQEEVFSGTEDHRNKSSVEFQSSSNGNNIVCSLRFNSDENSNS